MSDSLRICSLCGEGKPETEYHRSGRGRGGRKACCKACHAVRYGAPSDARKRLLYRANRGPLLWKRRDKLFCPLAQVCTTCGVEKPYQAFAVDRSRGRRRTGCNDCRAAAKRKAYSEGRHPSAFRYRTSESVRAYRVLQTQAANSRRSRAIAETSDGTLTPEIVRGLFAAAKECSYCGDQFRSGAEKSIDHVVPLARGGQHSLANVCIVCKRCNASKGSRTLAEWRARHAA